MPTFWKNSYRYDVAASRIYTRSYLERSSRIFILNEKHGTWTEPIFNRTEEILPRLERDSRQPTTWRINGLPAIITPWQEHRRCLKQSVYPERYTAAFT